MNDRVYRVWVEAWRARRVESRHLVLAAGTRTPPLAGCEGDAESLPRTSMRSTAKPFQLLPLVAAGGVDRFRLDDADLAVMAASHDGTESHAERVGGILSRLGLGPDHLQCGLQRPYFLEHLAADDPARARLYGPLHHNCSGNHAGFLGLARLHGVPPEDYLDPGSSSQRRAHRVVEALAGVRPDVLQDNCGAPCYDLPLGAIARCYGFLARAAAVHDLEGEARACLEEVAPLATLAAGLGRIAGAMAAHPEWVSGAHTGLARLADRFHGRLVLKNGAEGMLCAASLDHGAALALKVCDGSARAALPALVFLIRQFGWLPAPVAAGLQELQEPVLRGYRGQEVGRLRVQGAG